MLKNSLVLYCAPTLAGLKTANLFSCSDRGGIDKEVLELNRELNPKGVCLRVLSQSPGRRLIYVYRPDRLIEDWADSDVRECLKDFGYNPYDISSCVDTLSYRISSEDSFPHEIGLFLGFPVSDVLGFIENKGQNCKYCGIWKVYDDEAGAKKKFEKYQRCTDQYCKYYNKGVSIAKLCV